MTDVLGFPPDVTFKVLAFAFTYFVAIHSPVLLALAIVWRQRKTMKRRTLFVGSVMMGCYGFIALFLMAVAVPVEAFLLFIVPTLKHQGYLNHSVFLVAADFVHSWWWWLLPCVILISALIVALYLSARWNRIADALNV
jgi:hypothetical protein